MGNVAMKYKGATPPKLKGLKSQVQKALNILGQQLYLLPLVYKYYV